MLDCGTVIIDLHTGDLEEYECFFKKIRETSSTKTVILISSVFTWGDTPPKTLESDEGLSVIEESKLETNQEHSFSQSQIKIGQSKLYPMANDNNG